MKCPKCLFENRDNSGFCLDCGTSLETACQRCGRVLPLYAKFCDGCGRMIGVDIQQKATPVSTAQSERKLITVLFSDMTGYTAMSEKLDPEEVKEIMNRIFSEISLLVTRYEGFIDKYIGDAVMVVFGVPYAHEDDPVRAIRAAREIHALVEAMSPKLEARVGRPLSMHTGINTGLVVTGEISFERGKLGITGDTVNLASRLTSLARPGEIMVGQRTYRHATGHFNFERLDLTEVKGKSEPVQIYKVLSVKEKADKVHRLSGRRARLVGRDRELSSLRDAIDDLRRGRGAVVSISGDAGTGKSRLIEEVRRELLPEDIRWYGGSAFAYSQNIPYSLVIDFLNRAFGIREDDSPKRIKEKITSGVAAFVDKVDEIVPYIGSLYALAYTETENVGPEYWKARLQTAFKSIFSVIAARNPVVICFEDLHWSDPSSIELLKLVMTDIQFPMLVLCVYRPTFRLFEGTLSAPLNDRYREIQLCDLQPRESQDMVESLLGTNDVPEELLRFVQGRIEGNPFYLEEVINSLIESETLVPENGGWSLSGPINKANIPSTIQGVIAARLDRLEKEPKRILQEASVIGREFLYEILRQITQQKEYIDTALPCLAELDLIREKQDLSELAYLFKHALTQEVAYSGLLKKERRVIHERIASAMEQFFADRIPEFYETLAYHYRQGQSTLKAVDYLIKSGWKSQRLYAVEESDRYYREAFDLMTGKGPRSREEDGILVELLVKWAYVFNHRGDYSGLTDLFKSHEAVAETIEDKEVQGMFFAWLGWALKQRERLQEGYGYLLKAIKIGQEAEKEIVTAYGCAWLCYVCADLGLLDEAVAYGHKAYNLTERFYLDRDLFAITLSAMGQAYWFKGSSKKAAEAGKILFNYGKEQSCLRCQAQGHWVTGMGYSASGNNSKAIVCYRQFVDASPDPLLIYTGKFMLGMAYLANNQLAEALETLEEVIEHHRNFGMEYIGTLAQALQGVVKIATGHMGQGVGLCEDALRAFEAAGSRHRAAILLHMLGQIYLTLARGDGKVSLSFIFRNIGFILKNALLAGRKAEGYFKKAIDVARETGAEGILGQSYLDLGHLYTVRKKPYDAIVCFSEAAKAFETCEADEFLRQARDRLAE